jgi:hypothetical protein
MRIHEVCDDTWEISFPFFDTHCDHIVIQIEKAGRGFFLLDGRGPLVGLLRDESDKVLDVAKSIARIFGVRVSDCNELMVKACKKDFAEKLHRLVETILLVDWLCFKITDRKRATTLDDLARQQGVKPVQDVRSLGTWPGEVNDGFEAFVEELRHSK